MATQLIDLAYTKAELKEESDEGQVSPSGQPSPYPWGLCIRMDDTVLKKLGLLDPLPQVGGEIHLMVIGKVESVSSSASVTREAETSVSLQITMAEVLLNESADEEKGEKESPASEAAETKKPRTIL